MKLIPLILLFVIASTASSAHAPPSEISIRVPLPTAEATIGLYGRGLCMRLVEPTKATLTIQVDIDSLAKSCAFRFDDISHDFRPIESVKIMLRVPGYRIATHQAAPDIALWTPELIKLPKATIRGVIDPPPAQPTRLTIEYGLLEAMRFFGYSDGTVPRLLLADTMTDSEGNFVVEIPHLLHDPFIAAEGRLLDIRLHSQDTKQPSNYSITLPELYAPEVLRLDSSRTWGTN